MKFLPLPLLFITLLCSCGSIKPNAPSLPLSQINSTPLPDSKIDLPIAIDLSQVLNDFSAKIPLTLSGDGAAGPGQYRWRVQRQPFNLSLSGNTLDITDTAHFNVGGYLKNPLNNQWVKISSCDAEAGIGINATFNLLNNYALAANASLTRFDLQACQLNLGNINITPLIKPRIIDALNNALANANQQLKQYNFKSLLQPAWSALNQPVKIGDVGYININPSAIRIGKPVGNGKFLNLTAGITAKPVFYLNNPGKSTESALPDITAADSGNGFNLIMDVHLAYQQLNDQLKNSITNKQIPAGPNAYINLLDAQVYGTGNNHLLIKVKFEGKKGAVPVHGLLYFTCLPGYDVATGNFYVSDIDFDVSTIQKLKEGPAVWILTSAVKKYLGSEIHFNIAGQVNGLKTQLTQAINSRVNPHVILSGNVNELSLQGILPVNDYILVRIKASGNLAMQVN
jgi:hypothetical protein